MGSSALQEVGEGIKSRRCQMDYVDTRGKILFSSFTLKKYNFIIVFLCFSETVIKTHNANVAPRAELN